jgi:hypothetical protein
MSIFHDFFMTISYNFAKNIFEKRIFCHNLAMLWGKKKQVHRKSPQLPTASKGA